MKCLLLQQRYAVSRTVRYAVRTVPYVHRNAGVQCRRSLKELSVVFHHARSAWTHHATGCQLGTDRCLSSSTYELDIRSCTWSRINFIVIDDGLLHWRVSSVLLIPWLRLLFDFLFISFLAP